MRYCRHLPYCRWRYRSRFCRLALANDGAFSIIIGVHLCLRLGAEGLIAYVFDTRQVLQGRNVLPGILAVIFHDKECGVTLLPQYHSDFPLWEGRCIALRTPWGVAAGIVINNVSFSASSRQQISIKLYRACYDAIPISKHLFLHRHKTINYFAQHS